MEDQTRKLLRLLASDDVDRLLGILEDGPATETELSEALGITQPSVNRHLRKLEDWGIAASDRGDPQPRRGPRPRSWRLDDEATRQFRNAADSLALALREQQTTDLRDGISSRAARQIREARAEEA